MIRDTVQFLDKVGLGKFVASSVRMGRNVLQFIDKLDGTPLTPRPQIDVVQGSYNKPLHKMNNLL